MLIAAARVALGFRLPAGWRAAPAQLAGRCAGRDARFAGAPREPAAAGADRSRAAAVADAVAASQRREAGRRPSRRRHGAPRRATSSRAGSGRTCRRVTRPRPPRRCRSVRAIAAAREARSRQAQAAGIATHEQAGTRSARRLLCARRTAGREDRQDALRASRRTAWIVAGSRPRSRCCEALALIVLMPLKTVEPYTLLVDKQTGFVQALKPLDPQRISGDTALTQCFLVQYVIARESFDIDALQNNYRKVALWSADTRARRLYRRRAGLQPGQPARPLSAHRPWSRRA